MHWGNKFYAHPNIENTSVCAALGHHSPPYKTAHETRYSYNPPNNSNLSEERIFVQNVANFGA